MKQAIWLLGLFSILFVVTGCDPDPEDEDEVELITKVVYTLEPTDGSATVTLTFEDNDGDGGDAPTITGGTLLSGKTYAGTIDLFDESKDPIEDIGEEVSEEAEEHQFFFQTDIADLDVAYTDQDANGMPLGLSTAINTGDAAKGSLTIILRHEPAKNAANVSAGDITNAGGETDIEVTFPLEVR